MSAPLRAQRLLAQYGRVLIILLVVVALAAFGGAYQVYSTPPVEEVTRQTNTQQVSTSIETSAIVTGNTTLYEPGQRLVDQPAYIMSATPNLTIRVQTSVPAGTGVDITQRLTLEMSATRAGEPFWQSQRVFISKAQRVRNGELVSSTTINMSELQTFIGDRRSQVGTIGEFSANIRLNVTYNTGTYSGTLTATAPVVFAENAYWIDGDLANSRTHSQTVTRRVRGTPDPASYLGLVAVGIVALLGAIGIGYVEYQGIDINQIESELSESQFEEWISRGQFPTDPEKKYVNIVSLEDLVDIAIDSEKRVIHDQEFDVYAVVDGDLIYYFTTNDLDVESWLNM
ncbi:MAG: DUF5305 domain-containing protein [Halobacteriales archaeon]